MGGETDKEVEEKSQSNGGQGGIKSLEAGGGVTQQ